MHEANERLRRLYKLVEDGVTKTDDILKERIIALRAGKDRTQDALDRAKSRAFGGRQPYRSEAFW